MVKGQKRPCLPGIAVLAMDGPASLGARFKTMTDVETETPAASLRDLFTGGRTMPTLLLGSGIACQAVETYVSGSLFPSVVRDIGGLELLAWTTSLYIAASVLGSIFVSVRPRSITLNNAFVIGALIFAAGSILCGIAPNMIVVLAGRVGQGLGAGMMITMGYSFIRFVYPDGLQNAASTFYTSIWGIATFLGPTLGGMFANGHWWRLAFLLLVPLALAIAVLAPRHLPPGEDGREAAKIPILQIILIVASITLVSFAGTAEDNVSRITMVVGGACAILAMVLAERIAKTRLLPTGATSLLQPIAQVYFVIFMMMVVIGSDLYVPYFLQTLHGISPLIAGYMVAFVALGWTSAGLTVSSLRGRKARWAIFNGTLVSTLSAPLVGYFIGRDNQGSDLAILLVTSVGLIGLGAGIGAGWAHLVTLIMGLSIEGEKDKATAAINIVQSLGAAFGAALAGVVANGMGLVTPGGVTGAVTAGFWLYTSFVIPGTLAVLAGLALLVGRPSN